MQNIGFRGRNFARFQINHSPSIYSQLPIAQNALNPSLSNSQLLSFAPRSPLQVQRRGNAFPSRTSSTFIDPSNQIGYSPRRMIPLQLPNGSINTYTLPPRPIALGGSSGFSKLQWASQPTNLFASPSIGNGFGGPQRASINSIRYPHTVSVPIQPPVTRAAPKPFTKVKLVWKDG